MFVGIGLCVLCINDSWRVNEDFALLLSLTLMFFALVNTTLSIFSTACSCGVLVSLSRMMLMCCLCSSEKAETDFLLLFSLCCFSAGFFFFFSSFLQANAWSLEFVISQITTHKGSLIFFPLNSSAANTLWSNQLITSKRILLRIRKRCNYCMILWNGEWEWASDWSFHCCEQFNWGKMLCKSLTHPGPRAFAPPTAVKIYNLSLVNTTLCGLL